MLKLLTLFGTWLSIDKKLFDSYKELLYTEYLISGGNNVSSQKQFDWNPFMHSGVVTLMRFVQRKDGQMDGSMDGQRTDNLKCTMPPAPKV